VKRNERQQRAYDFLQTRVGSSFSLRELAEAAVWKPGSARTYISKHLKGLIETTSPGNYRVRREFRRLSFEDYVRLAAQTRRKFQTYRRTEYAAVVTFEFLLPLTREEELRRSLDDLFYSDSVEALLEEAGPKRFEAWLPRTLDVTDADYLALLVDEAGRRFGGYSVMHVSGRFRAWDGLLSRDEAAERLRTEQKYLIDETTGVARFIIPLGPSKAASQESGGQTRLFPREDRPATVGGVKLELDDELAFVRELFFCLFVEALIRWFGGEDEIWLLEDGPQTRRLHIWRPKDS